MATTVHQLFSLHVKSKIDDLSENAIKTLTEKFKKGICLIILDEMSIRSRSMLGLLINRLRSIHIDLDKVGVVFIGDPAQSQAIADVSLWSLQIKIEYERLRRRFLRWVNRISKLV